jgi:glycosyltransferase involved in cell wall biosynthesis
MQPAKTMVIDCPSAKPLPLHLDRFPNATVIHGLPTAQDFQQWLQGLDVVYTAETGYGRALWSEAERLGVKTVLHANYEFLDRHDSPTLWAAPSMWHFDDFPAPKLHLPVPIELDRLTPNTAAEYTAAEAKRFLHIVGRPAVHDRNGTRDLLQALRYVTSEVVVTVKCQEPGYVSGMTGHTPDNVTLIVDSGDVPNYWDNYTGQDVLVMPRRFGGLCLPVNEALGSGMPVIMPDISPNNTWLPPEWLVPATVKNSFRAKQHVEVYETQREALAEKIDQFATDAYTKAALTAREMAQSLSWDALRPAYDDALQGTHP